MKELNGLKSVLWVQVMFFINSSFFVFLGFDLWNKSEDLAPYYLYFAMFIGYRAFAIPISAWFVLKNKTKELIVTAYAFAFLLGIAALVGKNYIEDPYILVHLYSLPISFFTTMFQIGNNQMIVAKVEKDQYQNFFYVTGLFRNGIEMFVPIAVGVLIYLVSDTLSFVLVITVALVSLVVSSRLPRTITSFQDKTFMDIWKQKEKEERKSIARMHYFFIILSSFVIQYLDIAMQNYLNIVGKNEMGIGFLKSGFVLLLLGIFYWKKKSIWTDKQWFVAASVIAIGVLLIDILTTGYGEDAFILVAIVVLIYVLHNSSMTLSFKMVDNKKPFDQFAVLLKREVVRNIAKSIVALSGYFFAIQTAETMDFKLFTVVIIVFLAVSAVLYSKLNQTIPDHIVQKP